jgi:hypothetical protein
VTAERQILVQDPCHPYAVEFIEVCHRLWGITTVCFWTDDSLRRTQAWRFPALRSEKVADHYLVDGSDLPAFADLLRRRHRIAAVIPHSEVVVTTCERMAELLGLSWAQPEVMRLFRDKYALKDLLRSAPSGPRVNHVARVSSAAEVRRVLAEHPSERFVLKPSAGYGNSAIGFFESDVDAAVIDSYFAASDGSPIVFEEFIGGEEYFVNGQVDAEGHVTTEEVSQHRRTRANGRENVATGSMALRTDDPRFSALVDYTEHVITSTGLRRSPFHAEIKIDERGPCLIEIGARLAGGLRAYDDRHVHGGAFDPFAVAAHYYLTADDYGALGLDWERYDSRLFGHLNGIATESTRIFEVSGVEAVERRPEFQRWIIRPTRGDRMVPTIDILSLPWHLAIDADPSTDFDALEEEVRATIRINGDSTGVRRAARRVAALGPVVDRRARRMLHSRDSAPLSLPAADDSPIRTHA